MENIRRPGRPKKIENVVKQQPGVEPIAHQASKGAILPKWMMDEVMKLQMFQIRVDLNRWIAAINQAESVLLPDRTELMQVYKDITLDAHLSGVMAAIKNKIKSKEFQLVDKSENEDLEAAKILEQNWFFDWMDYVIESTWYGFSLVQLGPIINNTFEYIEMIPRQYVVPDWQLVKRTLYITTKTGGTRFDEPPYDKWLIMVDNKDLGILNKCVPHMIGKKNVNLYWWQFSELFGTPFRQGQTDIRDAERRLNMVKMMQNQGSNAWGVFDSDDEVKYIETSKTDAYQTYKEAIELANKEVSKLLAGQTMMFDSGSSRSQGEVHQDLFNDILTSLLRKIKFLTNVVLIPKMTALGIKGLENLQFRFEFEDEVKFQDKVKTIHDLTVAGYQFDTEFVNEYLDLGAKGKISIVPKMAGVAPTNEDAVKDILNMPTFAYLHKIDELRNSKSKMEEYAKMYKHTH